jgi:tetratricopeptide (TPR) repeat protein
MDNDLLTAFRLHQAGRFAQAKECYKALLDRDPCNADALHLFGYLHHQCGHAARAVELIGRAVALRPGAADFHANLAEAYRALGQHERASASGRTALHLQPQFPEAANNLGLALQALGRHQEAMEQFRAALRLRPRFAMAQNNLGALFLELGQVEEAIEALGAAVALDPGLVLAQANYCQLLVSRGQAEKALLHCQETIRLQPNLAAAHNNLGNVLAALGKLPEAHAAYTEAIRLSPDAARFHSNLGLTLKREGKIEEAFQSLRRSVELAPDDAEMWQTLARAHGAEGDHAAAIRCFERLVALLPRQAAGHCDLGWEMQEEGRYAEAAACYRRALELQPDHIFALVRQGSLHEELGQPVEAEACYRRACLADPTAPLPLAWLAMLLRGKLPDADRAAALACVARPGKEDVPFADLLFGLAHVHDARGEYADAAAYLKRGNALVLALQRRQGRHYDPAQHSAFVDRLIEGFTPDLFQRLAGSGDSTRLPVFVFGLPRTGTTLVEQVLASHSRVYGAGEVRLAQKAFEAIDGFPPSLQALDAAAIKRLGGQYLEGLRGLPQRDRPGEVRDRIVDKMPENYLYLGLLALLFPQATFIHVRRDLRDVAVSCWMTNFRGIRWACEPDWLLARIHDYRRLMAHWRNVLPVRVHEVAYERLVDDFEGEARRLVASCGLEWETNCLQFHRTARPVRTASVIQVRQPIYRQAVARWRHYENHLADLLARLPAIDF